MYAFNCIIKVCVHNADIVMYAKYNTDIVMYANNCNQNMCA